MISVRALLIAIVLSTLLAVGAVAAVPPFDLSKIYPTEAAFMASIKVYQDALAANPRDADAAFWLGDAYWETSELYRYGTIKYGADYLDKSIAALERTVSIDDKYFAAWSVLVSAYQTRGAYPSIAGPPAPNDYDKSYAAAQKLIALSIDPAAVNRGVPSPGAHNAEVAIRYQALPDRGTRFNAADLLVVADPDTKLLYRFPCPGIPPIARPAIFLTKWEAIDRGYKPASVCPPR
jgi:tetratricopeptide (TPR) repeat protein